MVRARLAPDTEDLADPRLLLRAFGGHQLVIGGMTVLLSRRRRLARHVAVLSLLIDSLDVGSAPLEQGARGGLDQTIRGGYAISGVGMLAFALASLALPESGTA